MLNTVYRHTCCVHSIVQRKLQRPFLTSGLRHFMVKPASVNEMQTCKIAASFHSSVKGRVISCKSTHSAVSLNKNITNVDCAAAVTRPQKSSVMHAVTIHTCKDSAEDKSETADVASSKTSSEEAAQALPNTREEKENIPSLQAKALSFLVLVDTKHLTPAQRAIHNAHLCALQAGDDSYTDPSTGYQVMTRLAHLRRGDCCGNACRHCPYGQKNAPEHLRRPYNSAFYD